MSCYSFLNENILQYPLSVLKIQTRKLFRNRNILLNKYKKYKQKNNQVVDDLDIPKEEDNIIYDPVTGKKYIVKDDIFIELPETNLYTKNTYDN
jgi:hypothetical protein